ncbi:MAG: hypothetical protein ABMA25_09655 [Ilumatobacteraceae bacterium]
MAMHHEARKLHDMRQEQIALGRTVALEMRRLNTKLTDLNERWDLPTEQKDRGRQVAWAEYERLASDAKVKFDELSRQFSETMASLTAGHRQPGGALEESQRQQAWQRLERSLEVSARAHPGAVLGSEAERLLEAAQKVGDTATLEAARRELPSYLSTKREKMNPNLAMWLDIQVGPPEAADARAVELAGGADISAASIAIANARKAASERQVPDTMAYPSGVDGRRVTGITERGTSILERQGIA